MDYSNLENRNDDFLLLLMKKGNKVAFDKLFDKYWEQAYNNAYKLSKNSDYAKDVVQDVFLSIWMNRERQIDNFPAYLYIAVRNRAFKLISKQNRIVPFLDILKNVPAMQSRPDENLVWKEFYDAYETLCSTLPSKRQEIFRLRFNDDLTTKEIAVHLGISIKTVQNQLGKAVLQLRASLLQLL